MIDGAHRLPVRVYWEDTDGSGIVYHTSYLRFAERGRTEMLRAAGMEQRTMLSETGLAFVVARMEVDFRNSAVLDDLLTVATRVEQMAAASLTMRQEIERGGTLLVAMAVRLACVGRNGRPCRLPAPVRSALAGAN